MPLAEVAPEDWDALCERAGVRDVYYTRGFVEASAPLAGGTPVFLRLGGTGGDVLFPCLLRSDPVDVVTPYGYGGPVGAGPDPPLAEFAGAYEEWCRVRGALSTFAVFHPLLGTDATPAVARFRRSPLAGTVAWRLDGDLEAGMHRHHRRLVRRARQEGLRASVDPRATALDDFVAIYEETMRRAGAAAFYLFPRAYWEALARAVDLVRVDVRAGGELVASVLGMGAPPFLHYHLGGSTEAGRRAGGSQLALLTLAGWGSEHGYELLHLGGGVGGRADSLLEFKLRFAPDGLVPSAVGKAVHDVPAYLARCGAGAIDWDGFFPAYREPR